MTERKYISRMDCPGDERCKCGALTVEREDAEPGKLPLFQDAREQFEKEWLSQSKYLDFSNWLVNELRQARAALPQPDSPHQEFNKH